MPRKGRSRLTYRKRRGFRVRRILKKKFIANSFSLENEKQPVIQISSEQNGEKPEIHEKSSLVSRSLADDSHLPIGQISSEQNSEKPEIQEESSLVSITSNDALEPRFCALSSHDFAEIKTTTTFIDKTLFIKSFFDCRNKFLLLTAPKTFGKSTLMHMLKLFLLGKTHIFEGLKIATEEKAFFLMHCKLHPVICIVNCIL
ncbi:uncharacterized protein LOC123004126 [Tribolium madens]|uniref:uncharacterized protein LOC123004126 n=1 Tax=Tribolium madens TaxID=41895 RepID=UPI001CF75C5A|nr:uncharacterized protein LOC123004126 [Tribolium madens]